MAIGQINKQYISSVDFFDTREILNQVLDIQNEDVTFLDVMELTGRSVRTDQNQYHHFVNEELYKLGTVDSVTGSGTTLTINLTTATSGACKKGDIALLPDGNQVYIQAKTGAALTAISVDGTTITGSVTGGDNISFFTWAGSEASDAPDPERWSYTKYSNQTQVYRGTYELTDIQKVSTIEVEFGGKPYIMIKAQHDAFKKFRANIGFSMMFSRQSANNFGAVSPTLVDSESRPVQTTKGLNQYVEDYGIQYNLAGSTISLSDFHNLDDKLVLARCPMEYEWYVGAEMNRQLDDYFNGLNNSGPFQQITRMSLTKSLDLGINSVRIYGRTIHKIFMPMLEHRAVTNYTGAPDYHKRVYMVPRGKVKVDAGAGMVERLRVRYQSGDGTDLRYKEMRSGALVSGNQSHEMHLKVSWYANQGLEALGTQQFGLIKPATST